MSDTYETDFFLKGMILHHAKTKKQRADLLEFLRTCPTKEQINILLKNIGIKKAGLFDNIHIYVEKDKINCTSTVIEDIRWYSNRLAIDDYILPDMIFLSLENKKLNQIIYHPYFYDDIKIERVSGSSGEFILILGE